MPRRARGCRNLFGKRRREQIARTCPRLRRNSKDESKLRICLVSHEYPPETARGGIGSQTWNKAHALAALGHEVQVLSATGHAGISNIDGATAGLRVRRIPTPDV